MLGAYRNRPIVKEGEKEIDSALSACEGVQKAKIIGIVGSELGSND